jgi:hypothetical protein
MTVVHHAIDGITFRTESDFPIEEFELPRFAPFEAAPGHADCVVEVHRTRGTTVPGGHSGTVTLNSGDCELDIDFEARRLRVALTGDDLTHGSGHFRFGAFPYSVFLHEFGAVMLHSACVDFRGSGALLIAPDEGGKTTAAGLMDGGSVLSDDMTMAGREDDGFRAWGTPWTSFGPTPSSTHVGGLFFLEKSDGFGLETIPFSEAFSRLWSDHGFMGEVMPSAHREVFFELFCDLASAAPAWLLRFPRESIDVKAVRSVLEGP